VDALPDWWQREKRRRQTRILIFLILLLILIAFFYWVSARGRIGRVNGVNFDTANYVAFVNQDKDGNLSLFAVRGDGNDLRRLTPPEDKSNKADPVWTMDGKSLLYSSNKIDSQTTQIYILGSGEPVQLTYGTGNKFTPAISADRKTAAFISQGAVKIVYLNGNEVRQLMPPPQSSSANTDGSAPSGYAEPRGPFLKAAFSQDGRGIAGIQSMSGELNPTDVGQTKIGEEIYTVKLGDQAVRVLHPDGDKALTLDTGKEVSFSWAANELRIATSYADVELEGKNKQSRYFSGIHIWGFEGPEKLSAPRSVLMAFEKTIHPKNIAWSPDGRYIAFECWQIKNDEEKVLLGIAVADANHTAVIRDQKDVKAIPFLVPTTPEGTPRNPRWSPDGSRMLYELSLSAGGQDICIINTDGTNPINLTRGKVPGYNSQAVWAPNRKK
jgi:TolB protein